ncbi:MAG: DUF393 domain-containing protein [Elusimicrobia bacterium]|nr:DUF393 domain-containing protein [Elusimicrobiota bacterium]
MLKRLWGKGFLEERPSASLGLFRPGLALVVGLHVFPTLFELRDNYLAGSFREYNAWFFPVGVLELVARAPDSVVWLMAILFSLSWLCFLLGLKTQKTGILMTLACYFFYARNSLHIGTLSWDILLVTVFLSIATPYLGDSFSLDAALAGNPESFRRMRPFFIQRLLQLQVAQTYFYTGLSKCAAGGNWLSDNPYWHLMNNPPTGVMRDFPLRSFLAASPELCRGLGLSCIAFETTLPLWLFWRRSRPYAILIGSLFQFYLWGTMHVPTIFVFLFPQLLLLFVDPEAVVAGLDRLRSQNARAGRPVLLFDGACCFCAAWAGRIAALDPTGRVKTADFRKTDLHALDPRLCAERCEARLQLLERGGRLCEGFAAFQRLSLLLPLLWPAAPLMHIPGLRLIGEPVYDLVASLRFRLSGPS